MSGYQGFVPYAFRRAETRKPGETREQIKNKFRRKDGRVPEEVDTFATTTLSATNKVRAADYAATQRPTPLIKVKDRKRMAHKKFVAKSMHKTEYPNHFANRRNETSETSHRGPAWERDGKDRTGVCGGYFPESSSKRSSTEDLFAGTSKVTSHIPGYRGFISSVSPRRAERTRDSKDHAFIVDSYKSNCEGYTGSPRANLARNGLGSLKTTNSRAQEYHHQLRK